MHAYNSILNIPTISGAWLLNERVSLMSYVLPNGPLPHWEPQSIYGYLINSKWQETLDVKIGARKIKECVISNEKLQKLFALFIPCLIASSSCALRRTLHPNNYSMQDFDGNWRTILLPWPTISVHPYIVFILPNQVTRTRRS